ncbi:hypothetical protein CPB84DRAFT_1797404 [Gymnopilus junonius]|uniref:Uncharacterized protein n=1 Tax=Gymnopilus junonius TaxID=109634 RepID=A0A9P5NBY1_GYMJU|nr:hypothetical protein CPB84DRAFT_1797404 [Gymnopilus junonius]
MFFPFVCFLLLGFFFFSSLGLALYIRCRISIFRLRFGLTTEDSGVEWPDCLVSLVQVQPASPLRRNDELLLSECQ